MGSTLSFYGAARTVTGSKHLLQLDKATVLVDCGLFQGPRELRERNWEPFPFDVSALDAVVLTHAHIDHVGMLPKLVRDGFRGPVYCTKATAGIAKISLPDSARLQEEEARYMNKHNLSRHKPALPLYTEEDAFAALKRLKTVHYFEDVSLPGGATLRFLPAGHILGAAFAEIYMKSGEKLVMSGDIGRYDVPIIRDPAPIDSADYLVLESTYGDRLHGTEEPLTVLEEVLTGAFKHGQCVLVPSFAIGRTQELLYWISMLQAQKRIPRIPIFLDSPMAVSATELYDRSLDDQDVDFKRLSENGTDPLHPDHLEVIRDRNASKALNSQHGPMVIISGSGMANGGRIVHHLKQRLDNPNTVVLFTGYQGVGTLGRDLIEGASEVEIHGATISVAAQVRQMTSLSAHADYSEMLRWMRDMNFPPKVTYLVHGEYEVQKVWKQKIEQELGWKVEIPDQGETVSIGG